MLSIWRHYLPCEEEWYDFPGLDYDVIGPSLEDLLVQYYYINPDLESIQDIDFNSPYMERNPSLFVQMLEVYTGNPYFSELLRGGLTGKKLKIPILPWLYLAQPGKFAVLQVPYKQKIELLDLFQQYIMDAPPIRQPIIVFRALGPFQRCKPGDRYIDPGFQSTSFDYLMMSEFLSSEGEILPNVVRIFIPIGSHVLFNLNQYQFEQGFIKYNNYNPDIEQILDTTQNVNNIVNNEILESREVILPAFSDLEIINITQETFCMEEKAIQINLIDAIYHGSLTRNPSQDRDDLIARLDLDNCWFYREEQEYASVHAFI